ncbi:MAG: InlB B-repeat-containing protein [Oscillospiraceae bacterium]|nr:InlB B-repeat-containing protein [Oscillospiraceae bacterium]
MSKQYKRLFAFLLVLTMVVGLLPTLAFAQPIQEGDPSKPEYVYTQEDNELLKQDVFAKIESVKAETAQTMGGLGKLTEQDYISIIPQVVRAIESSETFVPGSLQQNGNFLVWMTTTGMPCCYDPRMEAELHNTEDTPSRDEIARVEADAAALLEHYEAVRGGSPTSKNIGLIQPYWESSSSYSDSSFTSYSPYYKTTWQNLYGATGGQGVRYSMTNATVDNIASTMQQCGLVIFDSHGTTDYSGSNEDYTSRANSSYLCLTTNSGVTSTDTKAKTGSYGTYYDAITGSGYAYVNGQCIANHMSGNAPHSMLYMGICLGMATDRMCVPLRDKGVEVVYGYSQSVSFKGELQSIQSIMGYIQDGMEAGAAIEQSQVDLKCQWDPAYSSYTESQAKSNKVAFPVVASSEDTYPGHGNVDCVLTAYSTWTLFGETYTVTATSNNTSYGTVSVDGYTITASPKTGYYAQGYTVTSGTATVTQNGNVFTVNPSSDCTVRINFAAKTPATVTYMANGSQTGTASGYVGDEITLPTTAPAFDGWTFKGWIANTLEETATKPSFSAPGASYTIPAASTTLHALYTRFEETGGSMVYQLAETPENGGKYILVSEEGISGTTGYAVGNAVVTNSHYLTAISVTINDELCTASSTNLPKVLWEAASSGSGFTFYNAAVGKYMALDSSEYVYPSSTPLAWVYTDEGFLDNKTDSEGYYYLSYDGTNGRYTTSKQGKKINLYQQTNAGTTYYSTSPVTVVHEHTMEQVSAKSPSCTEAGNIAYWRCTACGKYFSDALGNNEITQASTVIAALGHNYVATVTAPTETEQGYTTHTCSRCGDSYVDSYVPALGSDFTVHFSVPAGITAPADMISNTNTGITLPTAEAPEGYTFLGWVLEDYDNVETRPANILTGTYIAPQEITLKALYSYVDGEGTGSVSYVLLTAAPSDWTGNYVITNNSTTTKYVFTGVTPSSNGAEIEVAGNATTLANSGITATDTELTNVADAYVVTLAASGNYYTVQCKSTGTYVGMNSSSYLSGYTAVNTSYCRWTPAINASGAVQLKNAANGSYPYFGFSTGSNYFWGASTNNANVLQLWKETVNGAVCYTTIIGEEHEHTPADAVIENNVDPSCTEAGSYDSVVYCSECGEELSRETVTVPALGHAPKAAVAENNVEPTCTAEGSYENVVYCERCDAELSRETVAVPALGHQPKEAVTENNVAPTCTEAGSYDNVVYCERCDAEISRETVSVDALGHNPGEPVEENRVEPTATAEGGYDTVIYCTRCNAELSREHTVLPATGPAEPVLDESIVLYNSIGIGIEIQTTFGVRKSVTDRFESWYIEVSKLDASGNVTETKRFGAGQEGAVSDGYIREAVYTDITAKEMGVSYAASFHGFAADGSETYSNTVTNTVRDYVIGELVKTDNDDATRKLAADLLNYGAAAQTYFNFDAENLVNANLSAEAQAAMTQFADTGDAPAALVNGSNGPNVYGSVSIMNRVVLSLTVRGVGSPSEVKVLVKNHETGETKATVDAVQRGSVWMADYAGFEAEDMRTLFDFVPVADGVETGTPLTWSVEGYAREARLNEDASEAELALFNALLHYVDAAKAAYGN